MNRTLSKRVSWPLLVSAVVLAFVLAWLSRSILVSCAGHFAYPVDDTYIHMAMAKTFSEHGVWGLTHYAFSSTSSSLLYTFLISVVYLFTGPRELVPLVLNIVFALWLLWFCEYALEENGVAPVPRALALILIVFAMPLPALIVLGMEHILQTALTMMFVYFAVRLLTRQEWRPIEARWLVMLGALAILSRYEELALVAVTAVLFYWRGRRAYAATLIGFGGLPIAIFGAYSVAQGWFPIPNSVIAKAGRPGTGAWTFGLHWLEQFYYTPSAGFLAAAGLTLLIVIYMRRRSIWSVEGSTLTLFFVTIILHMQFARVGWFFRYEAYLLVLGIYACTLGLTSLGMPSIRWAAGYAVAGLVLVACFQERVFEALWLPRFASQNIYDQQYQMGLFLKKYVAQNAVVLNDIGAASFLSDVRVVDLFGLSTIEVARAKINHSYSQEYRRELAIKYGAKMGILYKHQFDTKGTRASGGLPAEWVEVGSWTIPDNRICWSDTVDFYALDPNFKEKLIEDLQQFSRQLPASVTQAGLYTHSGKI